jgi:hypothetical protein
MVQWSGKRMKRAERAGSWALRTLEGVRLETYSSVSMGPLFTKDKKMRNAAKLPGGPWRRRGAFAPSCIDNKAVSRGVRVPRLQRGDITAG